MSEAKRFPAGCVASPHYLASSTGLAVLAGGGNALDAAIATNLTLGVVAPYMCGYGGDLFAIISVDDGLHAYNGSGRASASATPEAVRLAAGSDTMPGLGPLTVTVPGAVEAWFTLLERFGTRSFTELAAPALSYARDGFPLNKQLVGYFNALGDQYAADWAAAWREIYTNASGDTRFRQPALTRTILTLCDEGPQAFYAGDVAAAIVETVRSHGALMTSGDLADHRGEWVDTLSSMYRGVEVHQMPPNSQGVVALEALNIVEGAELGEAETADRHHLLIESTKLALADRETHVSDLEHMAIEPAELASKRWADERRGNIDRSQASTPAAGRAAVGGTAYLCAADADGMLVSLIQSNYAGFGSGVTVADWGINLQNRGAYFSLDPDHVNVIAPRKRTMHTLMPAIALRNGHPWLAFGTRGADGQAQTQLQVLTRVIDDGRDIQDAVEAPRWVVSVEDWSVAVEADLPEEIIEGLRARGHTVTTIPAKNPSLGPAQAIEVTATGYAAASDPRTQGAALGL